MLTLNADDIDEASGDTLAYSAQAFDGLTVDAYNLDRARGYKFTAGSYDRNQRGFDEKYFQAADGRLRVVFPDGKVYRFTGGATTPFRFGGTGQNLFLEGTFNNSFWRDPSKLWNAQKAEAFTDNTVVVAGDQLTFNTPANFAGPIYVRVKATDLGGLSGTDEFKVTVTNNTPVLDNPGDRTVSASAVDQELVIQLVASDADSPFDTLTFLAPKVEELAALAFQLDSELDLYAPRADFYFDHYGQQEKWIRSHENNNWYCLTPDGALHVLGNLNAGNGIGPVIARFDTSFYDNPALLYNAFNPNAIPSVTAFLDPAGSNNLHILISGGYTGTFSVTVFVTDGIETVSQVFFVTVQ
jgi:hypothetical protein